ncbi:MAG: hypothetical protein ABI672_19350 [Vicinamibacteria bacterium]
MELSIGEAWAQRNQKAVQCPKCGSERMRLSRRQYDGLAASIFRLKPMKCSACGAYVPIAVRFLAGSLVEPDSLHVPFRPATNEKRTSPRSGTTDSESGEAPIRNRATTAGGCPLCGSSAVRPATHGPLESYVARLHTKDLYRCSACNASFRRTNVLKLALMVAIFIGLLAGATYVGVTKFSHFNPRSSSPKLRNKPLPATSPPVFR